MKFFETPVMEVVKFAVEDVVTTSNGGGNQDCPYEGGGDELE